MSKETEETKDEAGGLSLEGRFREENILCTERQETKDSPFLPLLNMGQRFEPWHAYVLQLLAVTRILTDNSLSPEIRFWAASLLEQTGFGRHEDQEGPKKEISRAFLVDTLAATVSHTIHLSLSSATASTLSSSTSASSSAYFSSSGEFMCCPCCHYCKSNTSSSSAEATTTTKVASVRVLLNGSHWLVLGVLLEFSSLRPSSSSSSLPAVKVNGIVVLGTIQQAREIAWSEIESSLRNNYESVVHEVATRLGLVYTAPLSIFYSQGLQYGNQGCGLATDYNHQLLLTNRFDVMSGRVLSDDRIEKEEGYDLMILHPATHGLERYLFLFLSFGFFFLGVLADKEESVEMRHLSDLEYEAFQKGELSIQGEVLDSGRHRYLESYRDRSIRTPWNVEASLRLNLFSSLSTKWRLHTELLECRKMLYE